MMLKKIKTMVRYLFYFLRVFTRSVATKIRWAKEICLLLDMNSPPNWTVYSLIEGCDLEQDDPSILDQITQEEMLSPIIRMEKYMNSDVIFNR